MPHTNNYCYEFGPFRVNVSQRVLTRDGEVIALTPKTMEVLLLLLRNAGELVGKDELMKEVWPDSFVEEGNLNQSIFRLRRALDDSRSKARYIETVVRRGYRFIGPVQMVGAVGTFRDWKNPYGELVPSPVLAVLPFRNSTGLQDLDYLAEGVGDNITNLLSRISTLRVMSRTAFHRYKGQDVDPEKIASEFGVNAMLLGKIVARPTGVVINVELVNCGNGWLLWAQSFESAPAGILEIQDEIIRQVLTALRLTLTREEQRQITARYTESSEAYGAYIEGRFHWGQYTKNGIEKAIGCFRRAIELDPNYALAYSGIIDCYLRLATNYLPPERISKEEGDLDNVRHSDDSLVPSTIEDQKIKLRYEWDWKCAERELKRAKELKTDYPAAHQWHAAYLFVRETHQKVNPTQHELEVGISTKKPHIQSPTTHLTQTEEVQIFCAIAREQIEVGNFEAARILLDRWFGNDVFLRFDQLSQPIAADLLFTLGCLIGYSSVEERQKGGQKRGESYLSGSIALLEHSGSKVCAAEARIQLARCYFREGLFDEARATLEIALSELPKDQTELRSLGLSLLGAVERDSGRLQDSLERLREASSLEAGQLRTGRWHHEIATTLKELALSESKDDYFSEARHHFQKALYEWEAIGNHRNAAAAENNLGYLLLCLGLTSECESHLVHALQLFNSLSDQIRAAQVNDTLAQLYIHVADFLKAQAAIEVAVNTLEKSDGEAVLAEALITKGIVACRQRRYSEARKCFESAHRVAERGGDIEGAGRALLVMFEQMRPELDEEESLAIAYGLKRCFAQRQKSSLFKRYEEMMATIQLPVSPDTD